MTGIELVALTALGITSGLLIGCIGIGGVILVPALVYLAGVPVHTAIGAAMMAFLVSGVVGTVVYARKGSIRWDMTPTLWAGAIPGAVAGSLLAGLAPGTVLEVLIAALTIASGAQAMTRAALTDVQAHAPSAHQLAASGAVTGVASSMTGTGGPLVLVPLLLFQGVPVLMAIGLSQAIQLPIALLATVTNYLSGTLDPVLGALLGGGLLFGSWAGARLAHALPLGTLKRVVAWVLVLVGVMILLKLMQRLWS